MTASAISVGCIIHWKGYTFPDGATANKYLVIVGAQPGKNYLAVVATSQPRKRSFQPGSHSEDGYYHIPGGGKDWFKKDTWILFEEPKEISAAELVKAGMDGNITVEGHLRHGLANGICNGMKRCEDVSEYHRGLLGPNVQQPKT
jgi:hypothetical protein